MLLLETPRLLLLAAYEERDRVLQACWRVPQRERLRPIQPEQLEAELSRLEVAMVLTLSPQIQRDPGLHSVFQHLETAVQRWIRVASPERF